MDKDYDILFRVAILGDTGVGKTCLLQRFCDDDFKYNHVCTIGIDFKMKTIDVDGTRVRIQIWDTAGQERYRTITRQYYRKAQGVILVYDITRESSYLNVRKWAQDVQEYGDSSAKVMLIGNKSDREDSRVLQLTDGEKLGKELGMSFYETSAYTDSNVHPLFEEMVKGLLSIHNYQHHTLKDIPEDTYLLSSSNEECSEDEGIVKDFRSKAQKVSAEEESPICCTIL